MLAGIRNAVAGLQANDLQMDILGSRLGSEAAVPFPEVMDSTGASTAPPLNPLLRKGDEEKGAAPASTNQGAPSPLPGLLPADTAASLGAGDLARDMGLYLIAQAAYRMNARVFSASAHELKVLTGLGK